MVVSQSYGDYYVYHLCCVYYDHFVHACGVFEV